MPARATSTIAEKSGADRAVEADDWRRSFPLSPRIRTLRAAILAKLDPPPPEDMPDYILVHPI
jgi:hypothetical protein